MARSNRDRQGIHASLFYEVLCLFRVGYEFVAGQYTFGPMPILFLALPCFEASENT